MTCSALMPSGSATMVVQRLVRSTSVATAEGLVPTMRSPSH
ncbi:hypothetical protein [Streptomyces phaeochromogenes]|nr:hypothetical protein [Streptomyces phaeochromogenes]